MGPSVQITTSERLCSTATAVLLMAFYTAALAFRLFSPLIISFEVTDVTDGVHTLQ